MSDIEDDSRQHELGLDPVRFDDEQEEEEVGRHEKKKGKQHRRQDEEDDDDEDEDEEVDEDEEEDEEDEGVSRGRKRQKRRHKRSAVNRFLDVEAEVNEEEEEEEEDEEYGRDEFIAEPGVEGEEEDGARRTVHHARLDRRERELNDQDLARIAEDVSQRYKRSATRYTGDMNEMPQRLLMPSVNDANLWQVRCKPGRERDIVFSLMRKAIDLEYSNHPLSILSAFQRDSLVGMIYVEARSSKQVSEACNGLVGVYPSRGINLVPIEEMASLLLIKKQDLTVTPGSWVRIKRGKYQGDLAQVMDITENGEEVGLKFIPRIDLNPKDEVAPDGKKRKKTGLVASTGMRPPQRFFNYEEVVKVYGRKMVAKRNQVYVFQNDTYKDGFIEKDYKLNALVLENVNPTLDEITRFSKGQDGGEGESSVDLSIIAEASRKAAIAVLQPGDHVEVFEGEQSGVHGVVDSISGDIVTVSPVGVDLEGQKVQVPARSVRKRFKPGDHVKVMAGKNADETGLVVAVAGNVVTFLSDMSMQEVSVFSKDLREAAEVGASTNTVGNYELHDLVQLDHQTVGVIFKTERDSFRVLDQNGQVRLVQPHQISMRRDSNRAIATDAEGHELRIHDNVKENDGEGRKGRVLHVHGSFFAFLHNRDVAENGGVFVTRARSLVSLAPKGNVLKPGADLSKMNPALSGGAMSGGMVGSGNMGRGPRDRLIGVAVSIVKGPHKGYFGTVKDTNGPIARVELQTGNKVITIDKEKLHRRNPDGSHEPLEAGRGMGPPRGGGLGGGFGRRQSFLPPPAPTWGGSGGRTSNPYASGGKTPAWGSSSQTPNPYTDGGRTPSWNSRNTPAWNAAAPTPNPYGNLGFGGATPAHPASTSWGGATPRPPTGGWGNATPGRTWGTSPERRDSGPWDDTTMPNDWNSAPTPAFASAPTPAFGAPTPVSAQTPGAYNNPYIARTPAGMNAGHGAELSAETPALYQTFDTSQRFVPPKYWLADPLFEKNRVAMTVKIMGTRGDSADLAEWDSGLHEGRQGCVVGVVETASPSSWTATVKLNKTEQLVVPISYLVPVPPDTVGVSVLVLDGELKGSVMKARDRDRSEGTWLVSADDGKFEDIAEECLVMLDEEELPVA